MKPVHKQQRGVSLIEVLVAIFIAAVGLAGFIGLQIRSMEFTTDSYVRNQAMSIGQNLVEKMRVNNVTDAMTVYRGNANYTSALQAPANLCTNNACTPADMATYDIYESRLEAQQYLPAGQLMVYAGGAVNDCGAATLCVVVSWNGQDPTTCTLAAADAAGDGTIDCVILQALAGHDW